MNHHAIAFIALLLAATAIAYGPRVYLISLILRRERLRSRHLSPILFLLPCLWLSGCLSPTQLSTAQSGVAKIGTDAGILSADVTKYAPAVAALTGSTNELSYVSTIATDAQTLAPLLSGALALLGANTPHGVVWNSRGLAELHRLHISPRDPMALAKLSHILSPTPMHYRTKAEQAISCASREDNGKCGALYMEECRAARLIEAPNGAGGNLSPDLNGDWTMVAKLNQPRF